MARNPKLVKDRDERMIEMYRQYVQNNPHWRTWYIIQKLSKDFFLSESTVEFIIFKKYQ